jgi:alpha-tubulin suppressor-like RCC1 family protein
MWRRLLGLVLVGCSAPTPPVGLPCDPDRHCPEGQQCELIEPVCVPASAGLRFQGVAAGLSHSCGITNPKDLLCWGDNSHGQLGLPPGEPTGMPSEADFRPADGWSKVAAGGHTTCAIASGGSLWCFGQVGVGTDQHDTAGPERMSPMLGWTDVAVGDGSLCALNGDELFCQTAPRLGGAVPGRAFGPMTFEPPRQWTAIATNGGTFCGIEAVTGALWCWGDDRELLVGNGSASEDDYEEPQAISGDGWTSITLGAAHACGIKGGAIVCWGAGTAANGSGIALDSPTQVGELTASHIAAGATHTCAIAAGNLLCWGSGLHGQLGVPDAPDTSITPRQVTSSEWIGITAGGRHTCAIRDAGQGYCFGANDRGQLGTTTIGDAGLTPRRVRR